MVLDSFIGKAIPGAECTAEYTESNAHGMVIVNTIMVEHGGYADDAWTTVGLIRFSLYFPMSDGIVSVK